MSVSHTVALWAAAGPDLIRFRGCRLLANILVFYIAMPAILLLSISFELTYDVPCGSDLSYCPLQYLDRHQAQMRLAHTHIRDVYSGATYSGSNVRGGRILTSVLRHHSSGLDTSYGSREHQRGVSVPVSYCIAADVCV